MRKKQKIGPARRTKELTAVLYNIRSVYNTASIFRTADGAGFRKIYLCGITPSPLDRFGKVRRDFGKVSLGAEKYLEWEKRSSTTSVLRELRAAGYKIYAMEQARGAQDIFRAPRALFRRPAFCIVMGNEVRGLPLSVLRSADEILEIPMRGEKESLNVAVAFGIAAYQAVQK